ncbi:hypothetical protein GCK32_008247 [Trichostrongylus colubriformis]|uniref:Uncharacterized protein n=1 Tax=Trichostrongylus colubriformis TaxID=6319 RepID=A0AAN8IHF3_TRICO
MSLKSSQAEESTIASRDAQTNSSSPHSVADGTTASPTSVLSGIRASAHQSDTFDKNCRSHHQPESAMDGSSTSPQAAGTSTEEIHAPRSTSSSPAPSSSLQQLSLNPPNTFGSSGSFLMSTYMDPRAQLSPGNPRQQSISQSFRSTCFRHQHLSPLAFFSFSLLSRRTAENRREERHKDTPRTPGMVAHRTPCPRRQPRQASGSDALQRRRFLCMANKLFIPIPVV